MKLPPDSRFFLSLKLLLLGALVVAQPLAASTGIHTLTISGPRFLMDTKPFPYTGVSFFNALYNPTFNHDSVTRREWMAKFQRYGINVLRIWAQWDNARGFVDAAPGHTLFKADGSLQPEHLATLKAILTDADELGMVVQLTLFARESWNENRRLSPEAADLAVANLTRELRPHRNLAIQIWNEFAERAIEHAKAIKAIDPERLVTNSPEISGFLGDPRHNDALDFLTPHTTRQGGDRRPWEIVPREIAYLLARYGKPVVDDEPARNGIPKFGGPRAATSPYDHIVQIAKVWELGGYVTYHHDMFQTGYGSPAVPPSGIPDPEFNPYHHEVFKFLAQRDRFMHRTTAPDSLP